MTNELIKLDREKILNLSVAGNALNKDQLALLGVKWPPKKGWIDRVLAEGRLMTQSDYDLAMSMRGLSTEERRQMAPSTPERSPRSITCEWSYDVRELKWHSGCEKAQSDLPSFEHCLREHSVNFCASCGGEIVDVTSRCIKCRAALRYGDALCEDCNED